MIALQDLSQARQRWGEAASGFLTLFTTKIVLPGIGDVETLEKLSKLVGDHQVEVVTESSGGPDAYGRPTQGISRHMEWRPILPVQEIAGLDDGAAIAFRGAKHSKFVLTNYFEWYPWVYLAAGSQVFDQVLANGEALYGAIWGFLRFIGGEAAKQLGADEPTAALLADALIPSNRPLTAASHAQVVNRGEKDCRKRLDELVKRGLLVKGVPLPNMSGPDRPGDWIYEITAHARDCYFPSVNVEIRWLSILAPPGLSEPPLDDEPWVSMCNFIRTNAVLDQIMKGGLSDLVALPQGIQELAIDYAFYLLNERSAAHKALGFTAVSFW